MKRVLTAAVLIPLVLLAVFRAPLWLFALLITVVVILAIREYLDILEAHGAGDPRLVGPEPEAATIHEMGFGWINRHGSGKAGDTTTSVGKLVMR